MNVAEPLLMLICAIGGFVAGAFIAALKILGRHQAMLMLLAFASLVGACLLYDYTNLLPAAILHSVTPFAIRCTAAGIIPLFAGWLIVFLGRKFWRDVKAYFKPDDKSEPRSVWERSRD